MKTVEVKDTILGICHDRIDHWPDAVQSRILSVHDLHAADAVYHEVCNVNYLGLLIQYQFVGLDKQPMSVRPVVSSSFNCLW